MRLWHTNDNNACAGVLDRREGDEKLNVTAMDWNVWLTFGHDVAIHLVFLASLLGLPQSQMGNDCHSLSLYRHGGQLLNACCLLPAAGWRAAGHILFFWQWREKLRPDIQRKRYWWCCKENECADVRCYEYLCVPTVSRQNQTTLVSASLRARLITSSVTFFYSRSFVKRSPGCLKELFHHLDLRPCSLQESSSTSYQATRALSRPSSSTEKVRTW